MTEEMPAGNTLRQPQPLRILAKIISYIFHPLFIPSFVFIWLIYRFPYEFAGLTERLIRIRLLGAFWTTAFFPAFSVFLLWRLKFIQNVFLRHQKERIIPYIISMFFYWWMWYLSRNFTDQPIVLKFFYLGIFFTTVLGLVINNFIKISMHAMGVAGGLFCMILSSAVYHTHLGADISVAILVSGLVCTSRLMLSEHSNAEIYCGFIGGAFCQLLAYYFVM